MSYIRRTVFFVFAALFHWWLSTHFVIFGLAPQLLLVLTIIVAARIGPIAAMCYGFAWGLFLDVYEPHLFGSKALTLTLVGYGVGAARRQIDVSGLAPLCVITFSMTWAYYLTTGILGLLFMRIFFWVGWAPFLLGPVYNCLILPFAAWAWVALEEKA